MQKFNFEKPLVLHPDGDSEFAQELRRRQLDMLNMAEDFFSPRDQSYTILSIEFRDDGPYIWYPEIGDGQEKYITIMLSTSAAQKMSQACFQMAHETVHLLAPVRIEDATNLEEGVACYFSLYYMEKELNEPKWNYTGMKSYARVLELVRPRLEEDRYCIRRLRERQPSFRDISKEELRKEFPELTEEEVCFLTSKFIRGED